MSFVDLETHSFRSSPPDYEYSYTVLSRRRTLTRYAYTHDKCILAPRPQKRALASPVRLLLNVKGRGSLIDDAPKFYEQGSATVNKCKRNMVIIHHHYCFRWPPRDEFRVTRLIASFVVRMAETSYDLFNLFTMTTDTRG
eukprot:scaffold147171_cov18-Prasinocladus_malaysianus.AAC.2